LPLIDARTGRVLFTILVVLAALAFVYGARHTLIAFLFAIFFAYLIDPLVSWVQPRVKDSRGRAIAVVYFGFIVVLVLLASLIGSRLVHEAGRLANTLPDMFHKMATGQIAWTLGRQHGWSEQTQIRLEQFLAGHQGQMVTWAEQFAGRLAQLLKNAWWLLLIPILGVFFLKDGRQIAQGALDLLSRRKQKQFLDAVMQDINDMLAHFIRAQLILAVLSGIVYTVGLLLLRVPYAVVLGAIGGALEFIPVVGPLVAAAMIVFIALVTGYKHLLLVLLFLGAWRLVQDYVNGPRIMGRRTELHSLAVLFGVLAGAEIAGVVGVYLSIPMLASVRIFWRHWRAYMDAPFVVPPEASAPPEAAA
jgi:predicted PurR-regulated permease PerM